MSNNSSPQKGTSEQLYFAFGSNLRLDQMRRRCPSSRYIGTAKLHGYWFYINSQGYANVTPSRDDCVEGLVYLLSADDESTLDIYEGVSTADYEKQYLPVEIFTASINLVGRPVSDLVQRLNADDFSSIRDQHLSIKGELTEALVYVSERYHEEGSIRDEYIARMNAGIIDARKLGVSDEHIEKCLRYYVPPLEMF